MSLFAACGGKAISDGTPVNPGGSDSGAIDASASDSGNADAGPIQGPCPATPEKGSCTLVGLICEYGADPRPSCKDRAVCTQGGKWAYTEYDCASPDPTDICPATRAELKAGDACKTKYTVCDYPNEQCSCAFDNLGTSAAPVWVCITPEAGCPGKRPNLGTLCQSENQICNYGPQCSYGAAVLCHNGYWNDVPQPPCAD